MFWENNDFSGIAPGSASSPEGETRHLVNRLRLEFRTASQRQLEIAVESAAKSAGTYAAEKVLQIAREQLSELLTPAAERQQEPTSSEPPFRAQIT